MKITFVLSITGFLLLGCSSISAALTPTKPVHVPTATQVLEQDPVPSPTNVQLPENPDIVSDEYCKPPYAVLPVEDGNDISEDEIVHELIKIWLRRYAQSNAPLSCRIDGYTIDKVYSDPKIYSQVLEPRGDFMRVAEFSVRLTGAPSDWLSFAGELDQDNWLHIRHIVAITKTGEGYQLEFANP